MREMQWSENQFKELTAYDEYRQGRDVPAKQSGGSVAPYTQPAEDLQPIQSTTQALAKLLPPLVKLSAAAAVIGVVGVSAVSVAGAVMDFVSANAMAIGGGVLLLALVISAVGSTGGSDRSAAPTGGQSQGNVTVSVKVDVNVNNK
jgi:hypothetical protein